MKHHTLTTRFITKVLLLLLMVMLIATTATVVSAKNDKPPRTPHPRSQNTPRPPKPDKVVVNHGGSDRHNNGNPHDISVSCHARGHGVTCTPTPPPAAQVTQLPPTTDGTPPYVIMGDPDVEPETRGTDPPPATSAQRGDPPLYFPLVFNGHMAFSPYAPRVSY